MKAAFLSGSLISSKGLATPATASQPPKELLAKRKLTERSATIHSPHSSSLSSHQELRQKVSPKMHDSVAPVMKQKLKKPTASSFHSFKVETEKLKKDKTGRVRMSVRMKTDDHLLLKLLAAHSRKSSQLIIEDALREYALKHGDKILPATCNCMTSKAFT